MAGGDALPRLAVPPSAPAGPIETIDGQGAVRERLAALTRAACRSIRALQPAADAHGRWPDERRWVPARLVVERGTAGEYGSLTVRRSPQPLPCRLVIIDAAIAVAAPGTTGEGAALVVREPALVRRLLCLFEATWTDCAPAGPDSPTPDERDLLELMASGNTDESIARRLGICDRQVRRRIAELLRRLGASSRFAAGAEAVYRGWL